MPIPTIGKVLNGMTMRDFVTAAERNLREAQANARLIELEAREAAGKAAKVDENNRICVELDRPEYIYAKNAQRKTKKYHRQIKARNQ